MAPEVARAIADDRQQPRGQLRLIDRGHLPVQGQERLGGQVLGDLPAAGDAQRKTEYRLHVLPVKSLEVHYDYVTGGAWKNGPEILDRVLPAG